MSDRGFSKYDTKTLLTIRKNLLRGLDEVASSLEAGSFLTPGEKGAAPPSQSGQTTLAFLLAIQEELYERGQPLTW